MRFLRNPERGTIDCPEHGAVAMLSWSFKDRSLEMRMHVLLKHKEEKDAGAAGTQEP